MSFPTRTNYDNYPQQNNQITASPYLASEPCYYTREGKKIFGPPIPDDGRVEEWYDGEYRLHGRSSPIPEGALVWMYKVTADSSRSVVFGSRFIRTEVGNAQTGEYRRSSSVNRRAFENFHCASSASSASINNHRTEPSKTTFSKEQLLSANYNRSDYHAPYSHSQNSTQSQNRVQSQVPSFDPSVQAESTIKNYLSYHTGFSTFDLKMCENRDNQFSLLCKLLESQATAVRQISIFEVVAFLKFIECKNIYQVIERLTKASTSIGNFTFAMRNSPRLSTLEGIQQLLTQHQHATSFVSILCHYDSFLFDNEAHIESSILQVSRIMLGDADWELPIRCLFLHLISKKEKDAFKAINIHSQLLAFEQGQKDKTQRMYDSILKQYNSNCMSSFLCLQARHTTAPVIYLDYVNELGFTNVTGILCNICKRNEVEAVFDVKKGELKKAPKYVFFLHCIDHKTDVCSDCVEKLKYFHSIPASRYSIKDTLLTKNLNGNFFQFGEANCCNDSKQLNDNFYRLLQAFYGELPAVLPNCVYVCYQYLVFGHLSHENCGKILEKHSDVQQLNDFIEQTSLSAFFSDIIINITDEITKKLLGWLTEQADGATQLRDAAGLGTFSIWLQLASLCHQSLVADPSLSAPMIISQCLLSSLEKGVINIFSQAKTELPYLYSEGELPPSLAPIKEKLDSNTGVRDSVKTTWMPIAHRIAFLYSHEVIHGKFKFYHVKHKKTTGVGFFCNDCGETILQVDHLTGKAVVDNTYGNRFIASNHHEDTDICYTCAQWKSQPNAQAANRLNSGCHSVSSNEYGVRKQQQHDEFDQQNLEGAMSNLRINAERRVREHHQPQPQPQEKLANTAYYSTKARQLDITEKLRILNKYDRQNQKGLMPQMGAEKQNKAENVGNVEEAETECIICTVAFNKKNNYRVVLQHCGHAKFCESCITKMFEDKKTSSEGDNNEAPKIKCPYCSITVSSFMRVYV